MLTQFKRLIVVTREGCAIVTRVLLPRVTIPLGWMREVKQFVIDPSAVEWRYDVLYMNAAGVAGQLHVDLFFQDPIGARSLLEDRMTRKELTPLHRTQCTVMRLELPRTVPSRYV